MALEESSNEKDSIEEVENIKFLIDENQSYYFQSGKIDFKKGIFGSGGFTLLDI